LHEGGYRVDTFDGDIKRLRVLFRNITG